MILLMRLGMFRIKRKKKHLFVCHMMTTPPLAFSQSDLHCIQSGHLVHAFSGNPITMGVSIAACSIV